MPRGQVQKNGPLRQRLVVAALLLLYFLLAVTSLWNKSVTVDEYAHLPAACAALQHGTLDLYGKNPPLVRYLLGVPALAAGAVVPVPRLPTLGAGWDPWRYGDTFVAANAGPMGLGRYLTLLRAARLAGVALGALLVLLVYHWGCRIHGPAGGLAAAFLLALSPTFLAHARLSTVDVGATLALTLEGDFSSLPGLAGAACRWPGAMEPCGRRGRRGHGGEVHRSVVASGVAGGGPLVSALEIPAARTVPRGAGRVVLGVPRRRVVGAAPGLPVPGPAGARG